MKRINLVVPDLDDENVPKPGEEFTTLFIEPEGQVSGRETPGFFILRLGKDWVYSDTEPKPGQPRLPRQFLSLQAVHDFLFERYGRAPPLRVTKYIPIGPGKPKDFPAIWGGTRGRGKARVTVKVQYLGSFFYWDGRLVDPTKVGTKMEFN